MKFHASFPSSGRGEGQTIAAIIFAIVLLAAAPPQLWAAGRVLTPSQAALMAALNGGGTVTIACDGTITLTSPLTISQSTVVDAAGHSIVINGTSIITNGTSITTNSAVRLFIVNFAGEGGTVSFNNITFARARGARGSAIDNLNGRVLVTDCTFSNNFTVSTLNGIASGGALYNAGVLTLNGCTFSGNGVNGGAGSALGGAIYNVGTLAMTNCTLTGNFVLGAGSLVAGGGIYHNSGSTFTTPSAVLVNCTFSDNNAFRGTTGAGVGGNIYTTGAPLTLKNSILSGTRSGTNFFGPVTDAGHNLSSDSSPAFSAVGSVNRVDPLLRTLDNNGGPTPTMALGAGSPALDAGDNLGAPATDQRGVPRSDGHVDIGAFEGSLTARAQLVQFSASAYSANKNQTNAPITVLRTGGSSGSVSVIFATSDGTAVSNSDYSPTNGVLVFAAGETTKSFSVPLLNPTNSVGDKSVNLTLSAGTNGAILGFPTRAILTIVDPAAGASFQNLLTNGGYITVSNDVSISLTNTLRIAQDTIIDASGHNLSLTGNGSTNGVRVFQVLPNVTLTLIHVTVSSGKSTSGGGIYNDHGTVNLSNCTFSGNTAQGLSGRNGIDGVPGRLSGSSGSKGADAVGGAIFNLGRLNISNSVFSSNHAVGGTGGSGGNGASDLFFGGNGGNGGNSGRAWGGAIYNAGTAFVMNATFDGNNAQGGSGGTNGTPGSGRFPGLPGNGGYGSGALGGAIFNRGRLFVTNSTFSTNAVIGGQSANAANETPGPFGGNGAGAGILNYGILDIGNSTFANNSASGGNGGNGGNGAFARNGGNGGNGIGAAIYSAKNVTVLNCTFATNTVTGGQPGKGGVGAFPGSDGAPGSAVGGNLARISGRFLLRNTILSGGGTGGNCYGVIGDGGHNLSSDATARFTAAGSRNNRNPLLGVLADNGGPTKTIALLAKSPAINAANPLVFPATDQRGIDRPQGGLPDIGAFERIPEFSISGRITVGTTGLSNVIVNLAGPQNASATTLANGAYFVGGLTSGDYSVTPSRAGYGFVPTSQLVSIGTNSANLAGTNATNINFIAQAASSSPQVARPPKTFDPGMKLTASREKNITHLQWQGIPGNVYLLQTSTNLSVWTTVSTNIADASGILRLQDTGGENVPHRFFRIKTP